MLKNSFMNRNRLPYPFKVSICTHIFVTAKYAFLLMFAVVFMLLSSIIEPASGSTVTFEFGGELTQVGGPNGLAVGDPFTGTFSYTLEQPGTIVPAGSSMKYVFDSYSLTIQGQTVSSTGGDITIFNDSFGDRFHLNADLTTPAAIVTGSINGAPATQLFLALVNLNGNPFTNMSLPTTLNLEEFPDLKRIDVIFQEGSGAVIGEMTNLSTVPLPASIWLFISGLVSFAIWKGWEVLIATGQSRKTDTTFIFLR